MNLSPADLTSNSAWNLPTSTPVRAAPATYGSYVVAAPTDLLSFAVDNFKTSTITAPGIAATTAGASLANWSTLSPTFQAEAEASTVFLLTNLYGATPSLLGWNSNSTVAGAAGNHAKDLFGLTWTIFSYDAANVELYSLDMTGRLFCWDVPSPASSAGYAASQVGPLATCAGWPTGGQQASADHVTYSVPFPAYGSGADVYEMYWGDDSGTLNCVKTGAVAGDAGAGKAPAACSTAYTKMSHSLGANEMLGQFFSYGAARSATTGAPYENYVFIGGQYGTVYRVDDKQAPDVPGITTSVFCTSTGTVGTSCPATNTADYAVRAVTGILADNGANGITGAYAYWTSHGRLYQAPFVGSGAGGAWLASDIASVSLFTPVPGAAVNVAPTFDESVSPAYAYVAANNHLYKVQIPLAGTPVYASPLYRKPDSTTPQSLTLSATTTISVPSASWPLGDIVAWNDAVFVPSGYGNELAGGSVGAPVSPGISTGTLSGGLEQYGCTGSAASPFLSGVTTASYGAMVETVLIPDYEGGNLNFGYDTGGSAPTGGIGHQPVSAATAGWSCPSPSSLGSACGSTTACVGPPMAGKCVNDSDCSGATPYCDIFPDSSFGTCVACRTDAQCPQPTGAPQVCDTNNGAYTCVSTARCTTSSSCTNATDNPDYGATLTQCDATAGTTGFGLCASCGSNATCATFTSTPVCDQKNPGFSGFGTCVECTSDADCAANDEYANAGFTHCDQNPASPSFDRCAACTNDAQCSGGLVCERSAASASTTYFDTCVACDAANATACGAGKVCDTDSADATYDQCVTACTAVSSSSDAATGCGTTAPVCGGAGLCVECATNADCPGFARDAALGCGAGAVCGCQSPSDCPGGVAGGAVCENEACVPQP